MRKPRWLSWTGIALCALYLAMTTWLCARCPVHSDPKERLHPHATAGDAADRGTQRHRRGTLAFRNDLITVYLLVIPPTLGVLYVLGAMLGSVLEQ